MSAALIRIEVPSLSPTLESEITKAIFVGCTSLERLHCIDHLPLICFIRLNLSSLDLSYFNVIGT